MTFVEDHRDRFAVGLLCRAVGLRASTYYDHRPGGHRSRPSARDGLFNFVSVPLTGMTLWQTGSLATRQEVLENVRFVRERAAEGPSGLKPFNGLNLHEAPLSGLSLACAETTSPGCADFIGADLSGADLVSTNLRGAQLGGADLAAADLNAADLSGAGLSGAVLTGAALAEAVLIDADLTEAVLIEADLTGANLRGANLSGANLRGADLTEAVLIEADLTGANLRGADLNGAVLTGAVLTGVCYDSQTLWPSGFTRPLDCGR